MVSAIMEANRSRRADEMEAPPAPWLQRFDKPSRLLLHTLTSGPCGALAAFRALQRIRACDAPGQAFHWQIFTETLCAEEPVLRGPERTLTLRPILLLLPVLCQRNLFSLLHMVQGSVPKDCLSQLLQATRKDPSPDLWVQALRDLLQRGLREERSCWTPVPLTDTCRQQLKTLCQKIVGGTQSKLDLERKRSWFIQEDPGPELRPAGDATDSASQLRKRKQVAEESLDPEGERQRKRSRLEEEELDLEPLAGGALVKGAGVREDEIGIEASGHGSIQSQTRGANENAQPDAVMETREASQGSQRDAAAKVPDFMQMHVPRLKMLLERESNQTDGTVPPELQILNECTPGQLEGLCSLLQLSERPEHVLVHFCTWLLALTPKLSYTNAAVLTEQLFLQRVLSLAQPASRHLMAALTSFCSKYARPVCCALLTPVLQASGAGPERTKLVCELIEDSLEPEYVRLVLSQVLEMPWSEELITVVQTLLGRQVELAPELFNLLVLKLCRLAQEFARSMSYTKLMMAVLTIYSSNITPAHRRHLSGALDLNHTALRKSLQAALEQMAPR
ncbi:Fanconi anemia group E protein-like isoform X2 [Mauremys mutica]|nr:Fanconi anemia group E protein-like isoform X1 [Mauremys mutica]XP_044872415.1 Fanconi anemia group E protein-like isoform X2 [Mauremys mutica]